MTVNGQNIKYRLIGDGQAEMKDINAKKERELRDQMDRKIEQNEYDGDEKMILRGETCTHPTDDRK